MCIYIYVIADVIVTCPPSTRISGPVEGGGGECSLPLSEPLTKGGEHEEVDLDAVFLGRWAEASILDTSSNACMPFKPANKLSSAPASPPSSALRTYIHMYTHMCVCIYLYIYIVYTYIYTLNPNSLHAYIYIYIYIWIDR